MTQSADMQQETTVPLMADKAVSQEDDSIPPTTHSKGVDLDETNPVGSFDLNEIRDRGLEPFPDGMSASGN
jgi:hypothetical protein